MLFRRSNIDQAQLTLAAKLIRDANRIVCLTGAGVSTPSGIPDFRSEYSGLWTHTNAFEVASAWGFRDRPERFYEWMHPLAKTIVEAKPNAAHFAIAELERRGKLRILVTQNIDALHQVSGSRNVIELHGHMRTASCLYCEYSGQASSHLQPFIDHGTLPLCPSCEAVLKPDVVLYGDPLPEHDVMRAQEETLHCDLMIVAGSSLEVLPAADLPALAVRSGSKLILVNLGMTPYDHLADILIHADVADVLPRLVEGLDLS